MDATGHKDITNAALHNYFNSYELNLIVNSNLDSDKLRTKKTDISDNYNLDAQHFNKASLPECEKFLKQAEKVVLDDFTKAAKDPDISKEDEDYTKAFYDLGRLTHTMQDFYAHSNYINLAGPNSNIWNESVSNPNVKNPKNFKTGSYNGFSQALDAVKIFFNNINIFSKKKYKNGKDYDELFMQNSNQSHEVLNKDKKGTVADKAYEAKEGVSGYKTASDYAIKHTTKEWEDINKALEKNLDDKTYQKLIKKIKDFNPPVKTFKTFEKDIETSDKKYRINFNKKMGD